MSSDLIYFICPLIYFLNAFFKGMQHKNVMHDKIRDSAAYSFVISAFDQVVIFSVVKIALMAKGYSIILLNSTGAALGIVAAILLFKHILNRRSNAT